MALERRERATPEIIDTPLPPKGGTKEKRKTKTKKRRIKTKTKKKERRRIASLEE